MQFILIAYDIPDDKRRLKVADLLKDYGARVQYSVFEVWLAPTDVPRLRAGLVKLVDEAADSIRLYPLCGACEGRVDVIGQGPTPAEPSLVIL